MAKEPRRQVLIFEGNGGGHRFWYVKQLMEEARVQGTPTVLVTTRAGMRRQEEWATHLPTLSPDDVQVLRGPMRLHRLWVCGYYLLTLCRIAADSMVVVPDADRFVIVTAMCPKRLMRGRFSLLVMRAPGAGWQGVLKKWAIQIARRKAAVHMLGDQFGSLTDWPNYLGSVVADPVGSALCETKVSSGWQGASNPFIGLVAGVVETRKSVCEIITALDYADFHLRVVGRASSKDYLEQIETMAADRSDHVLIRNEMVSDEELADTIASSSFVLCVLKSNRGSSGILGQALSLGVPVVVGGNATIIETIRRTGAGECAEATDPESIALAVARLRRNYAARKAAAEECRGQAATPRSFYVTLIERPMADVVVGVCA